MTRQTNNALRIIQVSDCHVSSDPRADYRGQSADRNLADLLPAMRAWQPDLVLLTGDISEDGSAASYGRVTTLLGALEAPLLALPGNHDLPSVMGQFFPQGPWDGLYQQVMKNWQLVLLDSTEQNRVGGLFSQLELDQLEHCLSSSTAAFTLVALHHQPVPVNSFWIDRYALEEPQSFLHVLDSNPRVRCVAWGHVHQEFQSMRGEVHLLGSPSTVANSLKEMLRFTLDEAGPACRWLELTAEGEIETGLLRAGQSSATGKTSQRIR